MNRNKLRVGLFGYGCVGQGLHDVLKRTPSLDIEIKTICVKDQSKKRPVTHATFTFDKNEILQDDSIDVVVELIDNADDALLIVSESLRKGKAVVSANKKMLAENFETLYEIQKDTGGQLLYEGAVCASIPIIRTLEEYYDNDLLSSVEGIFNGTTNFILTKTMSENRTYDDVLKEAQALGFAESNPKLDVEGFDPKFKLVILAAHAFGLLVSPEEVLNLGIKNLGISDIHYANEKGLKIKLVPHLERTGDRVTGYVLPQFVKANDPLFHVDNEFNGVSIKAAFSDKQFFSGRGAGSHPTGAAVLSDLSALTYDYRYGYKKLKQPTGLVFSNDTWIKAYIRFTEKSVLEELELKGVEEFYLGKEASYVIGHIHIGSLKRLDPNSRQDFFVIKMGESSLESKTGSFINIDEIMQLPSFEVEAVA